MPVRVVTAPLPILTVDEAKEHLRIEPSEQEEDGYLASLIASAQAWIDGPHGWLERCVGVQELEWSPTAWPYGSNYRPPYGPAIEVSSISYVDPHGEVASWPVTNPMYFADMPAVRGRRGDIKIRYWAGFGHRNTEAGEGEPEWVNDVPTSIKHALLLLVGHWWQSRAAVRVGDAVNELPFGVEALLQPFRVYR